jgi:hypothetical protein
VESSFVEGRAWRLRGAVVTLIALVAAGCVGASASGSSSLSPAATPAASSAFTPTATSTPAAIDLSTVPLAPSGTWKNIRWVLVPPALVPASPSSAPTPDASGVFTYSSDFQMFGWSRGFVGFALQGAGKLGDDNVPTTTTATFTTSSSDGVHWHAGPALQQQTRDPLDIRAVYEGPAGLLAVEESGACGDTWVEGLLASRDGVTWQVVDMATAFGAAVIWNVSGGSTGFVATDTSGHAAWTSSDGQSWQPVKLDAPAFATSRIDDGTAFSAGYVLVGSTEPLGARNCGVIVPDPSALPSPTPPMRVPAVWWSADGASWVKPELPGAQAAYPIHMWVQRLDDHTLAAFDGYSAVGGEPVWVSGDGRTWKPLPQPVTLDLTISDYSYCHEGCFKTDGRHGIQLQGLNATLEHPYAGGMSLSTWTDAGLVALTQSGNQPPFDFGTYWTVGPTGVLVADAGQLWIGLPSPD